jgi:hypothetical protein
MVISLSIVGGVDADTAVKGVVDPRDGSPAACAVGLRALLLMLAASTLEYVLAVGF